jgi:hypothetical protein
MLKYTTEVPFGRTVMETRWIGIKNLSDPGARCDVNCLLGNVVAVSLFYCTSSVSKEQM